MRRAEGGTNIFGAYRVKNPDLTPKKLYFFQFPPARSAPACPKTRTLSTDIHVSELTCIPKNNSFVEIYPLFKARVHSQKSKSYIHRSPRSKAHVHLRGGGALKKIAPNGGGREHCWGISCEKSRFYAKKSYFFQWIRPCISRDKSYNYRYPSFRTYVHVHKYSFS